MICSLCMFLGEDRQPVAVINGQSVCPDHSGYVQGHEHRRALYQAVEQAGYASLAELQTAIQARRRAET